MLVIAIWEKVRLTPLHREMKCDPVPPMAMRLSKMSLPPEMALLMGVAPGSPPHGMFFNMTTKMTCENPSQAALTMKATGSKIEMFLPNVSDFLSGGPGLPYTKTSDGYLVSDAHFASDGGRAEIVQVTQVAMPWLDVVGMQATSTMLGYSPMFTRSSMKVESVLTLFGIPMRTEVTSEEWCGSFGGGCLAESLHSNETPIVPTQFEPAMCGLTKAICGKEADMKKAMDFEALGGTILGASPCAPETGLPPSSMCNMVTAPGVGDSGQAISIDPPRELTPQARSEMDEQIEAGETLVNVLLVSVMVVAAISSAISWLIVLLLCRRVRKAAGDVIHVPPSDATGSPTILRGWPESKK